jgi:hypothetical protein
MIIGEKEGAVPNLSKNPYRLIVSISHRENSI